MEEKKKNNKKLFIILLVILAIYIFKNIKVDDNDSIAFTNSKELNILSSYENADLEDNIKSYAKKKKINLNFTYMGDLDIVDELNVNSKKYDAVWIANSMWLYMLDNPYLASDSKSISISPVVFGVKMSKAKDLNLTSNNDSNEDILNLIMENKLKYIMPSATKTNTGATAYIGFLNSLAGNPEILTESHLDNEELISKLTNLFKGVERVSGDENFLKEMFLNNDEYEAVISDEASLININKTLKEKGKEELYLIYPTDGVAINDSTLGFISNDESKEDKFLTIQNYLLSEDGQKMLNKVGRRTWYGGTNDNVDKSIFNPDWGIDTTKYLNVTRFPSKKVMTKAINLYIEAIRKPTHTVFCLDYSGSMYGSGIEELTNAMKYILDYSEASADKLQFSKNDKITVITFSSNVSNVWTTDSGYETTTLINNIEDFNTGGGTALYDAIEKGLDILNNETDDYTKTIIAMTDGAVNIGSFNNLARYYKKLNKEIPVYSITFGNASETELSRIATLTNAKVFDGKKDLLKAFKEVRGYN